MRALSDSEIVELIRPLSRQPYIFLDTSRPDKENFKSYLFTDFEAVLNYYPGQSPEALFEEIQRYTDKGFWVCGYFNYEFGYKLEPALSHIRQKKNEGQPLIWLGVCKNPTIIDHRSLELIHRQRDGETARMTTLRPSLSLEAYTSKIRQIKAALSHGRTYQVNFTFNLDFSVTEKYRDLYLRLRKSQPTAYSALISTGIHQVLSFSPELFFRLKGDFVTVRPMKGTVGRGLTWEEDQANQRHLRSDKKMLAENVMIVDLLRNDLGRISRKVETRSLFDVEKYKTLYQLTSTVRARLKKNMRLLDVFRALFPSGSVTGAPKIETMKMIDGLESEPRGVYTGAIGFMRKKEACFNIPIRTIEIMKKRARMGVGGGIVEASKASEEYEEALLKSQFLNETAKGRENFHLFETLLWTEGKGYYLLREHLERLRKSSDYFSFSYSEKKILQALRKLETGLKAQRHRVRLTLKTDGAVKLEQSILQNNPDEARIKLSKKRIHSQNLYLYHKSSERQFYDVERAQALKEGYFEVLFLNQNGEFAEGAISNIFVEKNKRFYTPPVSCGLLPGIMRQVLLKQGKVHEKRLKPSDLSESDQIFIGNSVRGLIKANLD